MEKYRWLTIIIILMLLQIAGCTQDRSQILINIPPAPAWERNDTYDDIVNCGVQSLNYRGNCTEVQSDHFESIQESELVLSNSIFPVRVKYRNHIETRAGQWRNNIVRITSTTPNGLIDYDLKLVQTIPGILVSHVTGFNTSIADYQINIRIDISKDVKPDDYLLRFAVTAGGFDCGQIPCHIHVVPDHDFNVAPAIITLDSDGDEIRVNLVKFVGSVPSPETHVLVNDKPAVMKSDGSFYAYLQLVEGNNIIRISTVNQSGIAEKDINIIFTPALAVFLDQVDWSPVGQLMNVTGRVSVPRAHVQLWENNLGQTDNVTDAIVTDNGTFFGQVLRNHEGGQSRPYRGGPAIEGMLDAVNVIATLDQETDKDNMLALGFDPLPGSGVRWEYIYVTKLELSGTVTLKLGTISSTDCIITVKKGVGRGPFRMEIPVIQSVPGLTLRPTPATIGLYPGTVYHIEMAVEADSNIAPGTYNLTIVPTNPGPNLFRPDHLILKVIVQPK